MYSVQCVCVCRIPSSLWRGVWVIALRKPTQWVEPPTYTHVHPQNGGQQTTFQYLCATELTLTTKNIFKSDKIDATKAETTPNKLESERLGASVKGNIRAGQSQGRTCHNSHMHFHSHLCCGSSQLVTECSLHLQCNQASLFQPSDVWQSYII